MKKFHLTVVTVTMACVTQAFAQEAIKPAGQEHARVTEAREAKKEAVKGAKVTEMKVHARKEAAPSPKKHHVKKAAKTEGAEPAAPRKK
jgi:hypothetical protein